MKCIAFALAQGADLVVLGFRARDPTGYGRILMQDGEILAVREEIGVRRNPMIPFLPRDNRVNVVLGKIFERLRQRSKVA